MKVLVVHNSYRTDNVGGEDIVFKSEAAVLKKLLGRENVFQYEVSSQNIKVVKLFMEIWFSWKNYRAIKSIVKESGIDLVHVHSFFPILTPSVFKAAKDAGAKVVLTIHNYRLWCISGILYRAEAGVCEICTNKTFPLSGVLHKCYRNSLVQSLAAQAAFSFYRLSGAYKYIDSYFALTEFSRKKIINFGVSENQVVVKANSLATDPVISGERSGYIFVGRLRELKGIFEILRLWQDLGMEYKLKVVGSAPDAEGIKEKYAGENIEFLGELSREDTIREISESKYLIHSSLAYETFGLTIIEAFSCGVPVIGYNIGTRPNLIQNGYNGFLSDFDGMEQVIKDSLDYKLYDEMSKNALSSAKNYEPEKIAKRQINEYEKIINGSDASLFF